MNGQQFDIFSIQFQSCAAYRFVWWPRWQRWDRTTFYGGQKGRAIRWGHWLLIVMGPFKATKPIPYSPEWWNAQSRRAEDEAKESFKQGL